GASFGPTPGSPRSCVSPAWPGSGGKPARPTSAARPAARRSARASTCLSRPERARGPARGASAPLEVRRALFEEGGHAFLEVLGADELQELQVDVVDVVV